MWAAEGLDAAVTSGTRWRPTVEVLTEEDAPSVVLAVSAGTVTARRNDPHMRAASLTVIDPRRPPSDLGALLSPGGTEVRIWLTAGDVTVPMLTGPVVTAEWTRTGGVGGEVQVEVAERSVQVTQARWEQPVTLAPGTVISDALLLLLLTRHPRAEWQWTTSDRTLARAVLLGEESDSDPWDDLRRLAQRHGMRLTTGRDGAFRLAPIASEPTDAPLAVFGDDGLPLVELAVRLTRDRVYNGVIAVGTPREGRAPVRAVVWDTDPRSPTRADGPFGRRPRFYVSPLIRTVGQARQAAATILEWSRRSALEVTLTARMHPGLDPGDTVLLRAPRFGIDEQRLRVEEVECDLGESQMTITATGRRDLPAEGGDET